jgi:hypothetical protein
MFNLERIESNISSISIMERICPIICLKAMIVQVLAQSCTFEAF